MISYDTETDVICERLREIFEQVPGVKECWAPGKVGSVGKVNFHTNGADWKFLRKYKKTKFDYGTTHLGSPESKGFALKTCVTGCKNIENISCGERCPEMGIDGDWERGRVWLKKLRTDERAFTIYRRTHSTSSELVYTGEIVQGWNEDFTALWHEAMDEANLRA